MAERVVDHVNKIVWTGGEIRGTPLTYVISSIADLKSLFGMDESSVAILQIESLSYRLVAELRDLARGKRSNKHRVGIVVITEEKVMANKVNQLALHLFFDRLAFRGDTIIQGSFSRLVRSKMHRRRAKKVEKFAFPKVCIRNLTAAKLSFAIVTELSSFHRMGIGKRNLCIERVNLVSYFRSDLDKAGARDQRRLLEIVESAPHVSFLDCSLNIRAIEHLFCLFAWSENLRIMEFSEDEELRQVLKEKFSQVRKSIGNVQVLHRDGNVVLQKETTARCSA